MIGLSPGAGVDRGRRFCQPARAVGGVTSVLGRAAACLEAGNPSSAYVGRLLSWGEGH
jgi:hypothetical protein